MARHGHFERRGRSTVRPELWLLVLLVAAGCSERREERGSGGDGRGVEPSASRGLIVERVTPGGAAAVAGVRAGDILLAWRREEPGGARTSGELTRLFDAYWVEVLQASRGGVEITVLRRDAGGAATTLVLPISGNTWRAWVRLPLPQPAENTFRARLAAMDAGVPESVSATAAAVLELAREVRGPELQVAVALYAGRLLRTHAPGVDNSVAYEQALAAAEATGDGALLAWTSSEAGWAMQQAGRLADALGHHQRALEIYRRIQPGSLLEANALHENALMLAQLGELEPAIAALQEVLAARRRLAADSLVVAATLTNLGNYVSDFAERQRYHEEALAIRERLSPGSLDHASSLNNLGSVVWARGDLRQAEQLLERAQGMLEEIDAPPRFRGGVTGNLALIARDRGNLAGAEMRALEALRIFEKHEPRGAFHAETLNSIGAIRRRRADLEGAESSFRAALEVSRAIAETSAGTVNALLNLASTLDELGRRDEAERLLLEGAAIQERLDPASVTMAAVWTLLAEVARARGDAAEEERLLRASLARWEDQAPASLQVARVLDSLGELLVRRGTHQAGAELLERALALAADLAPGTLDEATLAHHLGRARRLEGRDEEALALYARAVAALESQATMLGGGDDTRTQFRAANRELYGDYVELLLEQGRVNEAFRALERSRAQAFVAMLAERDLVFDRELSAALASRRSSLELEYDRTLERLGSLSARDSAAEAAALRERLEELRRAHESLFTELRHTSPDLVSLRYPRARTPDEVSRSLRRGTLLLEFHIGDDRSVLFALASDGTLTAHPLDVGERELEALVRRFLLLLRAGPVEPSKGEEAVVGLARALLAADRAGSGARRLGRSSRDRARRPTPCPAVRRAGGAGGRRLPGRAIAPRGRAVGIGARWARGARAHCTAEDRRGLERRRIRRPVEKRARPTAVGACRGALDRARARGLGARPARRRRDRRERRCARGPHPVPSLRGARNTRLPVSARLVAGARRQPGLRSQWPAAGLGGHRAGARRHRPGRALGLRDRAGRGARGRRAGGVGARVSLRRRARRHRLAVAGLRPRHRRAHGASLSSPRLGRAAE